MFIRRRDTPSPPTPALPPKKKTAAPYLHAAALLGRAAVLSCNISLLALQAIRDYFFGQYAIKGVINKRRNDPCCGAHLAHRSGPEKA